MNKLHQLEVRRLLKELDYIKSDFDYKNEIVFEADNSFMRSLNKFLEKNIEIFPDWSVLVAAYRASSHSAS